MKKWWGISEKWMGVKKYNFCKLLIMRSIMSDVRY